MRGLCPLLSPAGPLDRGALREKEKRLDMKKLVLDRQNRKIAGVCAGIANYLDVDVTVVRIIFLISLIAGGLGFWAYLVVWAVAPQE